MPTDRIKDTPARSYMFSLDGVSVVGRASNLEIGRYMGCTRIGPQSDRLVLWTVFMVCPILSDLYSLTESADG